MRLRPRPSLREVVVVAAGVSLAGGCALVLGFEDTTLRQGGGVDGGGATTDGAVGGDATTNDGGTGRVSVSPQSLVLRRGAKTDVTVTIARAFDVLGDVTVRIDDLPSGVTAPPGTIANGSVSTTITIDTAKTAQLGPKTAHVATSAPTLPVVDLPLAVADPSGAPDVTFDGDGFAVDATRGTASTFKAIALQADGKIVAAGIAGNTTPAAPGGWLIKRFTDTGAADATFAAAALPADGEISAIAIGPAGKIVCVGASAPQPLQAAQLTVARLDATGALDTTFGGGVVRLPPADTTLLGSTALAVAVQADGAILVAGSRTEGPGDESGILTRFTPTGARDPAFNGGQLLVVKKNRFVGVAVETNGAITLAGTDTTTAQPSYFLARRTSTGAVDGTFGTAGALAFGVGFRANDFVRLADGSLALVGDALAGSLYTAGVATAAGAQVWVRGVGSAPGASFQGVAGAPDKRIVTAGHGAGGANPEARVDRLLADGTRDSTFGDGGTAFVDPPGAANGFDVTLFAAGVQQDGRIVVAGGKTGAGAVVYRLWP